MTNTTTKPSVPPTAGKLRPAARIKPGWFAYLFATNGDPDAGWVEVDVIADTNLGNRILVFASDIDGDGNSTTVHKTQLVLTLTAREAKREGLTG